MHETSHRESLVFSSYRVSQGMRNPHAVLASGQRWHDSVVPRLLRLPQLHKTDESGDISVADSACSIPQRLPLSYSKHNILHVPPINQLRLLPKLSNAASLLT